MAKLTQAEMRLLVYKPTPETWVCLRKICQDTATCGMANPGRYDYCVLCQRKQTKKWSRLMWPDYLKACKKAGIEPGTPFGRGLVPLAGDDGAGSPREPRRSPRAAKGRSVKRGRQ